MNLPDKLLKLQERLRIIEKNPKLDALEYMLNDYEKMSANDMERKYCSHPINISISSYSIIKYLKEFGHIQMRQGSDKMAKSSYFLKK
jgi:hypothetical protein